MHKEVVRLASLLAFVALATSRLGLIGHELVGHGGAALAFGGRIDHVHLFWFAGGWVRYHLTEPSMAASVVITMAGIAFELVAGTTLWFALRGDQLGRRIGRGVAAALVLHATWYLANGAWHGFGDGRIIYTLLGPWRAPVAIGAGLISCGAGFVGAREVLGALAGTLHGSRRRRIVGTAIALVLAGGLHGALTAGELLTRRDPTYAGAMRPERDYVIARELSKWRSEQAARGVEISPAQQHAQQIQLENVHRTFPFIWLLAFATAIAIFAGALRTKPAPSEARISSRLLAIAAALGVASTFAVIVIDALVR